MLPCASNHTFSTGGVTAPWPAVSAVAHVVALQTIWSSITSTGEEDNNINNNNNDTFMIEPLVFEPTVGAEPGRFIDMAWDETPKKNGAPRKDLVFVVELEKKDDSGQPFQVRHALNMLPKGRGKGDFKKLMEGFFETPLTPVQLASFSKALIVGQPVMVNYKQDHLGHVVFDKYTPVKAAQPVAS